MPYIGKQPLTGAYQLCDAIVTSATATYNLLVGGSAVIPGSANNCIVSLNGVVQAPVGAFTVSGSTITFSSTLSSSDVIDFILILGNVFDIGTPTNGAVTNSSLNSNVITGQSAVTVPATDDVLLCYDTSATALRKITFADFGNTPAFAAYMSTDQSVADNTEVKSQINTEVIDTDNCYDPTTNYRFTPNVAGKYIIGAITRQSNFTAGRVSITVKFNGAVQSSGFIAETGDSGNYSGYGISKIFTFNGTTDYVECFFFQNSGTSKSFQGDNYGTYFWGYRLIGV
jgi:hypothetical protein